MSEKNKGWNRNEFLKANPDYQAQVEELEQSVGLLERFTSFHFADGAFLALFRFQKGYRLELENSNNQIVILNLSHESMSALSYLYQSMNTQEALDRDFDLLKTLVVNQRQPDLTLESIIIKP